MTAKPKWEIVRGELGDGVSYEYEVAKLTKWALNRITAFVNGRKVKTVQHGSGSFDTREAAHDEALSLVRAMTRKPTS